MLWKLSLNGLKSRLKDYIVLFSGLVLASAVFYMFMTIALNPVFLKGAFRIAFSVTKIVFIFGGILLALITLVYLVYANSFLLSMRKRTYGTYMMLGASNSKIGKLIFAETLVLGLLSSGLGVLLGIGLTQVVSQMLISELGIEIKDFDGLYLPAILVTLIFFVVLFMLAALWNRHKLVKSPIISLLHEDQKPVKIRHNPFLKAIEAILGIGLLGTGYWAMYNYKQLMTNSVVIGFFTIVIGSYFVFDSLFTSAISLLQKNNRFKEKNLRSFILGQLKFRLGSYNRILSVISILFALSLGAITVGLNFNSLTDQALESSYYDAVLFHRNDKVNQQLKKVPVTSQTSFKYKFAKIGKSKDPVIIVNEKGFNQKQIKFQDYSFKNGQNTWKTKILTVKSDKNKAGSVVADQLSSLTRYEGYDVIALSSQKYAQIKAKEYETTLVTIANFRKNFKQIDKLQNLGFPSSKADKDQNLMLSLNSSKSAQYKMIAAIAAGFVFMGFFLGIAFLAILASTLMFRVLSGALSDRPRYQMLAKIGASKKVLKRSINCEIGILFSLPALLGIIDVLFGLQFFKSLLTNPYDKIWIPFSIFLILYLIYYLITVKLYQSIVLKK